MMINLNEELAASERQSLLEKIKSYWHRLDELQITVIGSSKDGFSLRQRTEDILINEVLPHLPLENNPTPGQYSTDRRHQDREYIERVFARRLRHFARTQIIFLHLKNPRSAERTRKTLSVTPLHSHSSTGSVNQRLAMSFSSPTAARGAS